DDGEADGVRDPDEGDEDGDEQQPDGPGEHDVDEFGIDTAGDGGSSDLVAGNVEGFGHGLLDAVDLIDVDVLVEADEHGRRGRGDSDAVAHLGGGEERQTRQALPVHGNVHLVEAFDPHRRIGVVLGHDHPTGHEVGSGVAEDGRGGFGIDD